MQGIFKPLLRYLDSSIQEAITQKRSFLLLGSRQVGKTTMLNFLTGNISPLLRYYLQNPAERISLERDPSRLIREAQVINDHVFIYIDEAQKVPALFDASQLLIDERKAAIFFTGSSARKLRRKGVNLLPGRIKYFILDPLLWGELGLLKKSTLSNPFPLSLNNINTTSYSIEDAMVYGTLPAIVALSQKDRTEILSAYSHLYIEEEVRAEALSRNIGAFSRFLELAAVESGTNPNLSHLSQESGVSMPTIKEYYSILEDTLIVERIDPYIKNARKRILSSSRYYFFDLGVRNTLARFSMTPALIQTEKGKLFEHAVILEIVRRVRLLKKNWKVYYWRTSGGAEVDCIIETENELIPIEIKSSTHISRRDLRGLTSFISDYKDKVKRGFVITMGERPERIDDIIIALPWQNI